MTSVTKIYMYRYRYAHNVSCGCTDMFIIYIYIGKGNIDRSFVEFNAPGHGSTEEEFCKFPVQLYNNNVHRYPHIILWLIHAYYILLFLLMHHINYIADIYIYITNSASNKRGYLQVCEYSLWAIFAK